MTPLQALNLFNSTFISEQFQIFSERLEVEAGEEIDEQIKRAFRCCFGSPPQADEMSTGRAGSGLAGIALSQLLASHGLLGAEAYFIHSMTNKANTHGPGENFMSTGLSDPRGVPQSSVNNWGWDSRRPFFKKGLLTRGSRLGIKGLYSFGQTDNFGHRAVEKVVTRYDFHATLLYLLGLDHERLSFHHNGIERRLTNVFGKVLWRF